MIAPATDQLLAKTYTSPEGDQKFLLNSTPDTNLSMVNNIYNRTLGGGREKYNHSGILAPLPTRGTFNPFPPHLVLGGVGNEVRFTIDSFRRENYFPLQLQPQPHAGNINEIGDTTVRTQADYFYYPFYLSSNGGSSLAGINNNYRFGNDSSSSSPLTGRPYDLNAGVGNLLKPVTIGSGSGANQNSYHHHHSNTGVGGLASATTYVSRTSILFVSISFIVLMIISLAWLVFYYVQRFRYAHAKDQLAKRLNTAAKKALVKIPLRTVKNEDKVTGPDSDACAVCIEGFKQNEIVRELKCGHYFHKVCVDTWLLLQRSCPICKLDILEAYGLAIDKSRRSAKLCNNLSINHILTRGFTGSHHRYNNNNSHYRHDSISDVSMHSHPHNYNCHNRTSPSLTILASSTFSPNNRSTFTTQTSLPYINAGPSSTTTSVASAPSSVFPPYFSAMSFFAPPFSQPLRPRDHRRRTDQPTGPAGHFNLLNRLLFLRKHGHTTTTTPVSQRPITLCVAPPLTLDDLAVTMCESYDKHRRCNDENFDINLVSVPYLNQHTSESNHQNQITNVNRLSPLISNMTSPAVLPKTAFRLLASTQPASPAIFSEETLNGRHVTTKTAGVKFLTTHCSPYSNKKSAKCLAKKGKNRFSLQPDDLKFHHNVGEGGDSSNPDINDDLTEMGAAMSFNATNLMRSDSTGSEFGIDQVLALNLKAASEVTKRQQKSIESAGSKLTEKHKYHKGIDTNSQYYTTDDLFNITTASASNNKDKHISRFFKRGYQFTRDNNLLLPSYVLRPGLGQPIPKPPLSHSTTSLSKHNLSQILERDNCDHHLSDNIKAFVTHSTGINNSSAGTGVKIVDANLRTGSYEEKNEPSLLKTNSTLNKCSSAGESSFFRLSSFLPSVDNEQTFVMIHQRPADLRKDSNSSNDAAMATTKINNNANHNANDDFIINKTNPSIVEYFNEENIKSLSSKNSSSSPCVCVINYPNE